MQIPFVLELSVRFLIPLLTVLIALYLGQRYGIYSIKKSPEMQQSAVGSVVAAVFGLLAFVLAFTFQIAANHYDARKTMLLKEVTDIRTIYPGLIKINHKPLFTLQNQLHMKQVH